MKLFHIIAPPRSGTTILYNTLCKHPDLAWFYADSRHLFRKIKKQYRKPLEGHIWKWFNHELDYRTAAAPKEKELILNEITKFCFWHGRNNFLTKNPDNCLKIRWLESIHPAKYIILNRERDAHLKSIYHYAQKHLERDQKGLVEYPKGFRGWVSILDRFGDGTLSMDAIKNYWYYLKSTLYHDIEGLDYIEVNYEDFCYDYQGESNRIFEFMGLKKHKIKPSSLITNMNQKYKEAIS